MNKSDNAPIRLLIVGSNNATPDMIDYAERLVDRAKSHGWNIMCGAAAGVDTAVINHCRNNDMPVFPYEPMFHEHRIPSAMPLGMHPDKKTAYRLRDEGMVAMADMVVGVWNGSSRNTKHIVEYAAQRGIKSGFWQPGKDFTWLYNPGEVRPRKTLSALIAAARKLGYMPTISVKQIWGGLLTMEEKRYETRDWETKYRGVIGIHASKDMEFYTAFCESLKTFKATGKHLNLSGRGFEEAAQIAMSRHVTEGYQSMGEMLPLGKVSAIAELIAIHYERPPVLSDQEALFGGFGEGRYAWEIGSVYRLATPVPAKGQLGVWKWDMQGLDFDE